MVSRGTVAAGTFYDVAPYNAAPSRREQLHSSIACDHGATNGEHDSVVQHRCTNSGILRIQMVVGTIARQSVSFAGGEKK
jgi:hypothetical protein